MRNKLSTVLVFICFLFAVSSCERVLAPPPPRPDKSDTIAPKAEKIIARIFLDATTSMEGFVRMGPSSNYIQLLHYLESPIVQGYRDASIEFHKFGADVLPIEEDEYRSATRSIFYHDTQVNLKTYIHKVMEYNADTYALDDYLSIVVTDLCQSGALTSVIQWLKNVYIKQNFVVGVLAIKSQFNGYVYDVPGLEAFSYKSNEDAESFRPFYLLLLGKHADVVSYLNRLESSGLPFVSKDNFIIFSRNLVNPLSSFKEATIEEINNLVQYEGGLVDPSVTDKRIGQFIIRRKQEDASLESHFAYRPLPYSMPFRRDGLRCRIIGEWLQRDLSQEGAATGQKYKFEKNADVEQSFVIQKLELLSDEASKEQKLIFAAGIKSSSLPRCKSQIYRYEIILYPASSAYEELAWWSELDMGGPTEDGTRTFNLRQFLMGLQQSTVEVGDPKVARFYLYVKRK